MLNPRELRPWRLLEKLEKLENQTYGVKRGLNISGHKTNINSKEQQW